MVTTSVSWLSDVLDDAVFSIETDPIDCSRLKNKLNTIPYHWFAVEDGREAARP